MKITKRVIEDLYENEYVPRVERDMGHNHVTKGSELSTLGKRYFGKNWKGVWLPSALPDLEMILKNDKDCCIFNTTQEGEHWVSFYRGKKHLNYYDSYGRDFDELYKDSKQVVKSTENDAEQTLLEENCGQRCHAYLLICEEYGEEISYFI
jgi:hypothetical protein